MRGGEALRWKVFEKSDAKCTMKEFKWMEGWDEKDDDLGGRVLNGRDANGKLEHGELVGVLLEGLFDELEVGL